ncbi:3-keto-disaccharide hydrolase [Alienimonas californiensis]|uniref:3-keto-alpha-glucoside-1,2-lyase/3-keto-2-hydroxy-glucal hydratase domain-containing protein n=1 Tax=Alienimonas californiensis TaxID=2527989 RepID=A0A517PBZ3_9PLAN|nr:DUF1080 domain-containing protein [Alienimonas californiensis]QDT16886.1 hypothetical protein CA12_29940 [Alienimonas californiensis]
MFRRSTLLAGLCLPALAATAVGFQEWKSGIEWKEPAIVTPGETAVAPPSDAIILFGGTDLSAFNGGEKWEVKHGVATAGGGTISTKQKFGDVQVHLEFRSPLEVEGQGQGRGNSGLYLMNRYEVQIMDSYENQTQFDSQAAALYKQSPPLVNACRPPGAWQTYDVLFEAPRFDENGVVVRPAYATVIHNGVAVQVRKQLNGATARNPRLGKRHVYEAHPLKESFNLQWHGDKVSFRNIWVRELELDRGETYPDA